MRGVFGLVAICMLGYILKQFRDTCRHVTDFLHLHLAASPGSSSPLLFPDVNDGLGIQRVNGEWAEASDTSCIAKAALRRVKLSGGAGELFRTLLCSSDSQIDLHCAPLPLTKALLQLMNRCGLADHCAVHARFWYLLEHPPNESGRAALQSFLLHGIEPLAINWDAYRVQWAPLLASERIGTNEVLATTGDFDCSPDSFFGIGVATLDENLACDGPSKANMSQDNMSRQSEGYRRSEFIKELELAVLVRWELWAPPVELRTSDVYLAAVDSCLIEVGRMNRVDAVPEDEAALVELLRLATLDAASEQIGTNEVLATTGDFDCSPDLSPGCGVASLDENLACDGPNKDNMSYDSMSSQFDACENFSKLPNFGKNKNRSRSRSSAWRGSSKNSGRAVKCSLKNSGRAVFCAASAAKHDPALCVVVLIVGTKQAPLISTRVARFELAFLTSKVGITQGLIQEAKIMISGGVGNSDHLYSVGPPWSDGDVDKKTKPNHKDF